MTSRQDVKPVCSPEGQRIFLSKQKILIYLVTRATHTSSEVNKRCPDSLPLTKKSQIAISLCMVKSH